MLPELLSEQLRQPVLLSHHNLCQLTKTRSFIIPSPKTAGSRVARWWFVPMPVVINSTFETRMSHSCEYQHNKIGNTNL
jgi:hypothetical protein